VSPVLAASPRLDAATLRMVTALARSRATLLPSCGCEREMGCTCVREALVQFADDLEAIAGETERGEPAAPRLTVERAIRRHLEVALSSALRPHTLQAVMRAHPES
jgi:hypothetical protein